MENNRDSRGCFIKGHPGMKRKGSISKRDKEYLFRIEYVLNLIEDNMKEELQMLKPKQRMELWIHLLRYVYSKPPRIKSNRHIANKNPAKITFEIRE
jgi:hypothetical protein